MYVIQNAIRNILRNKGRNIILALISFLIICAATVTFLINSATKTALNGYQDQFGNRVTIGADAGQPIAVADHLKYGDSALLQKAEFSMTAYGRLVGLKALDEELPDGSANMILSATSRSDLGEDFRKGLRSISKGKAPAGKDACMVSEDFAKHNGLSVGSVIKIAPSDPTQSGTASLQVSGIYSDNSVNGTGGQPGNPLYNRNNEVLTSVETATGIGFLVNSTGRQFDAVYYLKDRNTLEAFKQELRGKGLSASATVTANDEEYQKAAGPVEKLSKISNVFLLVVLCLGAFVLVLVSVMSMRERKYEVGVLRAMGMKKSKVVLGMLAETLAVTVACLVIGLGAGTAAAQPVANVLMQQSSQSGPADADAEETPVAAIKIRMTASVAGEISLVALLLAGLASAAGVVYIVRFEPNRILSERN